MARYWVRGPGGFSVANDPAPTTYRLQFTVNYFGSDVSGFVSPDRPIEAEPSFTDTPAVIAAKVIDQVMNDGSSIGLTVARADGLLPLFIRGS